MGTQSEGNPGMSTDPVSQSPIDLTPSERARAVKCFEVGTQRLASDIDYAIEMFLQCVQVDPGSPVYLQSLLGALRKKHAGKSRGGLTGLWSAGSRAGMQKSGRSGNWREVLKQGLGVLKSNPFDHGCLLEMAKAAGQMQLLESQRVYLKAALDAAPADADVNRQCAAFLAERGEYDQAIACWVRVAKVKGLEEESQREVAKLQVAKTIVAGEGMTGRPNAAGRRPASEPATGDPVSQLRARFDAQPADIDLAIELADLLEREVSPEEAEKVLARALSASGNDLKVREHLEDRQMRWSRQRVLVAERRVQADDSEKNRATLARLREALLRLEVETYAARVSRYPENLTWKYELAMRLKALGNYNEAIRHFQDVLQDARRKGVVSLELGECFQKIKQYQLAMRNYTTAVEVLTDRDMELRKRALYRAGVLAGGLEDIDASLKYLSTLAGLDFGYRDVAQRLDKLNSIRDNH
jgi:tetratricopeptide (TPR) repeat protein